MISRLTNALRARASESVSATGLAVFRIAYGSVLLAEIVQLFRYRQLVFHPIPYLWPAENAVEPLLLVWMVAVAMLIVGWMTKPAAIASYVATLVTFSSFTSYEYHIDFVFTTVNALLVFLPVSNRLSVDSVLAARKGCSLSSHVSLLLYDAIIFSAVAIVYFDSVLFKLWSPMWIDGLGVWLPAAYPHNTWMDVSELLDNRYLMQFASYLTLALESVFILLMWNRRYRIILLCVGLPLHIGIILVFPIPLFALAMIALYLPLVPPHWWDRIFSKKNIEMAPVPSARPAIILSVLVLVFQLPSLLCAPITGMVAHKMGAGGVWSHMRETVGPHTSLGRPFLGTVPHGVFIDSHFRGYDDVFAVTYVDSNGENVWLPILDEEGRVGSLNTGRRWAKWTFRVSGTHIDMSALKRGLRDYTAFWSQRNGVDLRDASFRVLSRRYDPLKGFEKGFHRRQAQKEWRHIGNVTWKRLQFKADISNPEEQPKTVAKLGEDEIERAK
jgi:uncharacterized membrane protein YphA (DoxX/SURF4 family)